MPEKMRAAVHKKAYLVIAGLLMAAMAALTLFGGADSSGGTELERRMERILGCMDGAGNVRVLIHANEENAAVWSASVQQREAEIVGVLIVAEGAGDAAVAARLAQAAGAVLDIDQSRIEVLRMEDAR